jgi:alkanesulfonate monooxygenase SsuD/methylene tetrahydromethanopterin reductase-like flavin-dependent oxidoreductase (luciferase family)
VDIGVALTDAVADAGGNVVDVTVRLTRQAAEAGLRSAWLGQRLDFDSVGLAGIAGREVPGIAVGTAAVPVFGRHPIVVSSQAQTTQAATHGRYTLGLALGTKAMTETAFGLPYERPVARLREFLTALRVTALAGASRVAELVIIGDEEAIATAVRNYFDAGATEVMFTQTNLLGQETRLRTWRLLGELAAR